VARFDLGTLEVRFDRQVAGIANALSAQRPGGALEVQLAEYSLGALQDAWSRFVRDLIIRSSLGNATTASGTILGASKHGILTQRDALSILRSQWTKAGMPAWWEPSWFRVDAATTAVTILAPGNGSNVVAAIGSSANPIDDLRALRNFAAHRLPNTAALADAVRVANRSGSWRQPRDIIGAVARGGAPGEVLFDSWCRRLRVVAAAAVK
jgi:hypothetical protein